MKLQKIKKKALTKIYTIGTTLTLTVIKANNVFSSSIGTAEVKTATDNIQRVITSIAMPLGRNSYFCKYSNCCIKDDSKCK